MSAPIEMRTPEAGERLRQKYAARGLGDIVARLAKPIARAIDAVAGTDLENCSGCAKRQEEWNEKFPIG